MENVNLTFWVKAISLAANFGSTRSASTSIDHKQRIKKSNFLTPWPPPPPPLTLSPKSKIATISILNAVIRVKYIVIPSFVFLFQRREMHVVVSTKQYGGIHIYSLSLNHFSGENSEICNYTRVSTTYFCDRELELTCFPEFGRSESTSEENIQNTAGLKPDKRQGIIIMKENAGNALVVDEHAVFVP